MKNIIISSFLFIVSFASIEAIAGDISQCKQLEASVTRITMMAL